MSALPRPDLPPGPTRALNDALHDLHHHAGWPSLRTLAKETGVSHTTVSKTFSRPGLPTWGTLELLVEAMHGDTTQFRDLWLAASTPTNGNGPPAPRIAGRRAELDAVRRHLEHGTGLLIVTGEAGIGKTTLISTATTGHAVAAGHCLPLSTDIPLMPFADALRGLMDLDERLVQRALRRCAPFVEDSLVVLLPEMRSGAGRDALRRDDRNLLFTAITRLLRALADEADVALVLDDLHWADDSTLDLLEHLVGRGAAVPLVGTWRTNDPSIPTARGEWFARVRRLTATTVLDLGPLSRDETAAQLALISPDAAAMLHSIHARTQGQPLFTQQLALHVRENAGLPAMLAELLDRRLSRVGHTSWTIVRLLGVAARPVRPEVLSSASGLSRDRVITELHVLQDQMLIRRSGRAVELQHPLLGEAVQRRLVAGEDLDIHASLARALGAEFNAEPAEVAEHWRRAGVHAQELPWRVMAARSSARRFDRGREAEHWLRAVQIWPPELDDVGDPPISRAMAYVEAIDGFRFSMQWDRAAALSDSATDILGAVEDDVRAELLCRAAEFRGQREGAHIARELIDESLQIFTRVPVRTGTLRALDWKVNLLEAAGRFNEARDALEEKLAAAERLGDTGILRDCLVDSAWHVGIGGDVEHAMRMLAESKERAHALIDPLGDIREAVTATDVLLVCGWGLDAVAAAAHKGLDVADRHGIANLQVTILRGNLATALLRAGRLSEASSVIAIDPGDPVDVPRHHLHGLRAAVDSGLGDHPAARARLSAIWDVVAGNLKTDLELLTVAGTVGCWAGDAPLWRPRLLHALDLTAGMVPVRCSTPALVVAARCSADAAATEKNPPLAHDDHAQLVELARRSTLLDDGVLDDTYLAAHAMTFHAELARLREGSPPSAWSHAASLWDRVTRPHDAAYCRWRAAQCALRDGRGTVAARLLKRAATDAREHVPLSRAIAGTAAG